MRKVWGWVKLGPISYGKLMTKCSNADRYKGLRPPTCLKGKGCDFCKAIYAKVKIK